MIDNIGVSTSRGVSLRIVSILMLVMILNGCGSSSPKPAEDVLAEAIAEVQSAHEGTTIAVAVIDPVTSTRFAAPGDTTFHAASTMKVPVMIEVFRQAEEGRFELDDSLLVENRFRSIIDGTEYSIGTDSDDGIYNRLGMSMSIRDLTYNMITVSSNLATNLLIDLVTASEVQATLERLGGTGVSVLRGVEDLKAFDEGMNNTATASGLAALYEALMEGRAVSPESDREMIEILLDQRFVDGIPRGLPTSAKVAHKTGSITRIYHDGGIIYPEGHEPYVLVVMTRGFDESEEATDVIAEIAAVVQRALRQD